MLTLFNDINTAFCNALGISSYLQGVVIMVCINIIAVLGMSVLTGFTRLFSFGNAGFMSIGAYTAAILTVQFKVNFLIAIILGALFAGLVAFLLGSITLRLKGDYFLITCLGFGECVRVLFNYTKNITGGSAGYPGIPNYSNMLFCVVCVVLAFFIAWRLIHSKYGRNLTSIRENELAAEAVGVNAYRFKRMSFTFSAIYAGWAGALYGGYLMYIVPASFNLAKSCELITTTVIGGLGSLTRLRARRNNRHDPARDIQSHVQLPYAHIQHRGRADHHVQAQRTLRLQGIFIQAHVQNSQALGHCDRQVLC